MIIVGGGGGLLFLLMIMIGLVFLVGIPLSRAGAVRRSVLVPHGGWEPVSPAYGWQPPAEPALPAVTAADVSSLRDRLGHDVRTLEPGDDPVARQALADASERYSTASTLLERATSDAQLRTAWLAAVEGLAASQTVRQRLGLPLGPPPPSMPTRGPRLERPARIDIEGRSHLGSPTYEPGRPHWFPGGQYGGRPVPAGWYDVPFWPSALVLGGLAGWTLGGMMGAGAVYGDDVGGDLGDWDGGFDGGGGGDGGFGGFGDGGGWDGGTQWGGGGDWGGFGGGGGDWGGFGGGGGGDFGGGFGGGGDW